ncbi:MAG: hypothetical protein DFNUSKGM_003268, partial [Candidatus Fervidibacter sacchari]
MLRLVVASIVRLVAATVVAFQPNFAVGLEGLVHAWQSNFQLLPNQVEKVVTGVCLEVEAKPSGLTNRSDVASRSLASMNF